MEEKHTPDRFQLKWRDGAYYVSAPNINSCEVVRAKVYDKLERQRDELQQDLNDARNGWESAVEHGREVEKERDELLEAVQKAYGYLFHVNNEPGTPNQYPPERAAYEARKILRDFLTHEQRGDGINAVREKIIQEIEAK